jgi:hypothetical protein
MEFARLAPGRAFMPFNSLLYYAQRLVTPRRLRHAVVNKLSRYIRLRHGELRAEAQSAHLKWMQALQCDGYTPLGNMLTAEELAQIREYLSDKQLHARDQDPFPFSLDQPLPRVRMAEYTLADILACPHLLELANHPGLLRMAGDYIGCKPTISAIGLRWSFPDDGAGKGLQEFHRDCDDWRFIKVFLYLTDVDEGSGPHVYVQGTHLEHCSMRLRPYGDAEIMQRYGQDRVVTVTGPAGFAFAVNTHGIHKGTLPSRRPRLMLQIQYSLLPVYIYRYRPLSSRQPAKLDRYINRLFLSGAKQH